VTNHVAEERLLNEIHENMDDEGLFKSGVLAGRELLARVKNGNLAGVKEIVSLPSEKAGLIFLRLIGKDSKGNYALHLAVEGGYKEIVEYLMEQGMVAVNAKNSEGKTPKDLAEENGNNEILGLMLGFEKRLKEAETQ